MAERIHCCVPFCRRTIASDKLGGAGQWICGDHWRLVPALFRRRKAKLYRLYAKRFGMNGYWAYPGGSPDRLTAVKLDRLCRRAWDRCKSAAIEAAGGIG